MSDSDPEADTDDPRRLSPTRIGQYAECPRKYQFETDWEVDTPEDSKQALNFGSATHAAIAWLGARVRASDPTAPGAPWREGADTETSWRPETATPWGENGKADPSALPWPERSATELSEETIHRYARKEFEAAWEAETDPSEYLSDAHYDHDRQIAWASIEAYLDERGYRDIRRAVGFETPVTFSRRGMQFNGRIDAVVRTEAGIELLDYKQTLGSIVNKSADFEDHVAGTSFSPRKVKSLIQAATYIEAISAVPWLSEPPAAEGVAFTFYGLLGGSNKRIEERPTPEGLDVDVDGMERPVEGTYAATKPVLWEFIERCYAGITEADYDARERLEERSDGQGSICDRCTYNDMCPEMLQLEVTRVE